MISNESFLSTLGESFRTYLETSPRSNEKLKVLHGKIAEDLSYLLGREYKISSLDCKNGCEEKIIGRYIDKTVDIVISKKGEILGGVAVKFVMSNYFQNANNYFENMLGETANIRCNNKKYFQMLIIPKSLPYYKSDGQIFRKEEISKRHLEKYLQLSKDDPDYYLHTPTKTFLGIVELPPFNESLIRTKKAYNEYYLGQDKINVAFSKEKYDFNKSVIYNDYEDFIRKVEYTIKSI